jgi:hypothetical protein
VLPGRFVLRYFGTLRLGVLGHFFTTSDTRSARPVPTSVFAFACLFRAMARLGDAICQAECTMAAKSVIPRAVSVGSAASARGGYCCGMHQQCKVRWFGNRSKRVDCSGAAGCEITETSTPAGVVRCVYGARA